MSGEKQPIHDKPVAAELVGTNPQLVLVGMCPGGEEAKAMRPFVGRAGRLLRKVLAAIPVESYVLTNVVKLPYYQSPPSRIIRDWIPQCRAEVLERNMPTVLLGNVAANVFFAPAPMYKRRGTIHCHGQIPMMCTWHPSFALRPTNPQATNEIQTDIEKLLNAECKKI
ncbi:MAG: uracil-DNA glycosylase family protein [Candidatus Hodarchaeales archaeon]|jgi:DNA polymerase